MLKQHKFILLQFWRSEIQNKFYGAKIKVPAGLVLPGGSREEFVSLSFSACRVCLQSLACGPFLHFQSTSLQSISRLKAPVLLQLICFLHLGTLGIMLGPSRKCRIISPSQILKFIIPAKSLSYQVAFTGSRD